MYMIAVAFLMAFTLQEPKVAITTTGAEPASPVDARFGRSPWILIHDPVKDQWQSVDNSTAVGARGAAGVGTAQLLAQRGVKVVISGQCGPKALSVLSAAGIKVYDGSGRTAMQALSDYKAGRLAQIK